MTSTNDGKDVKSSEIVGQKAKTYYIELYKTLEARLSVESELGARTSLLCEAWRRVHCLCQHSATSTHPHLIGWLQRHTAQTILQSEWRLVSINQDKHNALGAAIDFFILECQEAIITRRGANPQWETQLLQRAEWLKSVIPDPWGNAVLKALLDPSGEAPSDQQIVEWLKEERGVFFVTRLRQLASSKKTVDIALSLATAVMERVRACALPALDSELPNNEDQPSTPTFTDTLTTEAGFTVDVWELITDIEFVLLYSDRAKCIALAKKTPLKIGYQLVERLHCRLDISSREKRLWKNAKDVAILIAQVMVARCMVVPTCVGTARSTLYGCSRSLVKLLPAERLPAAMAALAAPAATARHLHTLAVAVDAQCKNERKPFVCELYIRAITAGMNELEKLKLTKEKEPEARAAERVLGSWFTSLGSLLGGSARLAYECALTAFSLHPSHTMYERIRAAPQLQPAPVHKDIQEPVAETNSEFGSWATDSRSQTNFVKTSETLNLKKIQQHSNVLSTAVLNEGEALGLSPELCQDLIVLLSGPRVKTLSWDMDKEILIENCRSYMERTHGGTRALTTELKYLNLDPDSFLHLPEEEDEDESDIYYGIEKGYEHLVELQEPEEIWDDAVSDTDRTESCYSTENETMILIPKGRKKGKLRRHSISTEEEALDPLSDIVPKSKHRSHSSESIYKSTKERSKDRSKEKNKKEGQPRDSSSSGSKSKVKKDNEKTKNTSEAIAVDVVKLLQKPKKERKKKEKKETKEKKNLHKHALSPTSGLSRLLGKKVMKRNILDTHEHITKRETETDLNNQVFITDSDYDSQGKSSIASVHTEGNDSDVLFDGLFSMEDIKSPEKSTLIASDETYPLQFDKDNSAKRKSLIDSVYRAAPNMKNPNSCYVQNDVRHKELTRPSSATPSLARTANETSRLPSWCSSNSSQSETTAEVKLGIKRLIEFRKQKSAIDLLSKTKEDSELEYQIGQNYRNNYTINKKFANKPGLVNRSENSPHILPGTPKAISVPDIPKVIINKKQSQQLNHLKNEVDNYVFNQGNSIEYQTYPLNNLKKIEVRPNNEQSAPTAFQPDNFTSYTNLKTFEQKQVNSFHQSESGKVNTIAPNTSTLMESTFNTKPNTTEKNVSMPDQNRLHDFFKELHRSNNAGVSNSNRKVIGRKIDTQSLYSSVPNYCAKLTKPSKKVENAPNTFARLKYMHKNKQGDNISKQNSDQLIQNKLRESSYLEPVKDKNIIDTLLSRVDCTVIRKTEKNPQKKVNPSAECLPATSFINVGQTAKKKAVTTDDRLAIKSNYSQPASAITPTQSTRNSMSRPTMPTNCNEDQLRHLLRQNSKILVTGPQIRSEIALNKEVTRTQLPSSTVPLNSQNLCQQLGDDVYNRLLNCPIKIQPCQNVPVQTQNVVTVQPKSSSIMKTKDIYPKNSMRHKSAIVHTKEPNIGAKTETKKVNNGQQDWESVLNDLLSHKTPSRDSKERSLLYKKDKKHIPSNILYDKSINNMNSSNNINQDKNVASRKQDKNFNTNTAIKQNKHAIHQKSRCTTSVETNTKSVPKDTSDDLLYTNNNDSPITNQPIMLKSNDQSSKKTHQSTIIKRIGKTSEQKFPLKKDLNIGVSPTNMDQVISNVPSSEYDILGELMDDDLRQEIGELSSDDESLPTTNVITKGKVKGLSSKLVNPTEGIDSTGNLNVRQNQCSSNKQAIQTILQSDTNKTVPHVRTTTTVYETVIKTKHSNTLHIHDNAKCQTRMQKNHDAKILNVHQASNSTIQSNTQQLQGLQYLDNKDDITNQSQIIDPKMTNNCMTLEHNVPKTVGINSSKQNNVKDNTHFTSVNQNSENSIIAVSQQHPAIKNVVLIRPEIVYEPYTVQVHQIPKTVHSNICNLNTNTFVAVNAMPTISMFGTQFTRPVINPLIIGKTITVPITSNTPSLVVNACNKSNNAYSNLQLHTTSVYNNTEMEKRETTYLNNICDPRTVDENTAKLESNSFSKTTTIIDKLVDDIPKNNDSTSRNNLAQPPVLTEVRERHVALPYAVRCENSTVVERRHSNDLDSSKIQNITNRSTPQLVLISGQSTTIDDVGASHLDINSEKKASSKVQENNNLTSSYYTANNIHLENTSLRLEDKTGSFGSSMVPMGSKNSISNPSKERCTLVQDVDNLYPRSNVKVNDCMINRNYEKKILSEEEEKLNVIKSCSTRNSANTMDLKKSLVGHEHCNDNVSSGFVISASKTSITHPVNGRCNSVDEIATPFKTDDKAKDINLNENFNENRFFPVIQENRNLTVPYYTPSGTHQSNSKKGFVQCRNHSDDSSSKFQSGTTSSNSIFSTRQHKEIADIIKYNPKIDVKLNECLSTKITDRKVLSDVQEKQSVILPEKIILKASISTEEEIKKESLKTREERIIRKKTAILNRQVHIFNDVEPIPLTYAPLNNYKDVPDKEEHKDYKMNVDFVCSAKSQTFTPFDDAITTTEHKISNDLIVDEKHEGTDILHQKNVDNDHSVIVDGSKENNESNTTECIGIRLPSSSKEANTPSTVLKDERLINNNIKTKVKLKVKKAKDRLNKNKLKGIKTLKKKRQHKMRNIERNNIMSETKDCVTPISNQKLDVEKQLQGSIISKNNTIGKTVHTCENVPNIKDDVQSNTALEEKIDTRSVHHIHHKNGLNRDNFEVNDVPEKKCTTKDAISKDQKLENINVGYLKLVPPVVNSVGTCDPFKIGPQIRDEMIMSNKQNLNGSQNNDITSTKQSSLAEQHVSASHRQVSKNATPDKDSTVLKLPRVGKSRLERDENKFLDSYKDDIIIQELPRKKDDNPLKRSISIKLANGNSFKATVSGKLQVDINSLFEDPTVRSVLMNNVTSNSRCILNIQQVISASGENVKTRIIPSKVENRDVETINLISDDEEETLPQVFNTEFGKYKVQSLNDNIFNNHQKRFSQKCFVKIQKYNAVNNICSMDSLERKNEVKDADSVNTYVSESMLPEEIKLQGVSDSGEDKDLQIIEIDDSSNDSINTDKTSTDILTTQTTNTANDIELNIKELKETLLKDLFVDTNNKSIDTNISQPAIPINMPMDLENLKDTLMKDLCDSLGNMKNDILQDARKIMATEVDLKDNCRNDVTENVNVTSTSFDNKDTKVALKNSESKCKHSIIKDIFIDSTDSTRVSTIKKTEDKKIVLPTSKDKLSPSKRCQLRIEKCDDLVKKYQIMKNKRCFVTLERCDRFINSVIRGKSDKNVRDIGSIHLCEDRLELKKSDKLFAVELDTSSHTLKRSGSFSILNEINIYDQSLKLSKEIDKSETYYEKMCKKHNDVHSCQSDYFMTKLKIHSMMKQILPSNIISDDISTDCDSDHDDSNIFETTPDSVEEIELPIEYITYQVPSLLQISLKFLADCNACECFESNETKSLKINCSLHHLKRKSNVPESTIIERKIMKLNDDIKYQTRNKQCLSIKINEKSSDGSSKAIRTIDIFSKQQNYTNELQHDGLTSDSNIKETNVVSLTSNLPSYINDSKSSYENNILSNQIIHKNEKNGAVKHNKSTKKMQDNEIDLILNDDETNVNNERHDPSDLVLNPNAVKGELTKISCEISSEQDHIQGKNIETFRPHANKAQPNDIADNISSKEDKSKEYINFNEQLDEYILNPLYPMTCDISKNENKLLSEYGNVEKMNGYVHSSDQNNASEDFMLTLSSDSSNGILPLLQNKMMTTKNTDKIYETDGIINETNKYSNVEQKQHIITEHLDVSTVNNTLTLKEQCDMQFCSNTTEVFVKYKRIDYNEDLTNFSTTKKIENRHEQNSFDTVLVEKNCKSPEQITPMELNRNHKGNTDIEDNALTKVVATNCDDKPLALSDTFQVCSEMFDIEVDSINNQEKCKTLTLNNEAEFDKTDRDLNSLTNQLKTISGTEIVKEPHIVKCAKHSSTSTNNTEALNYINDEIKLNEFNDEIKSVYLGSSDGNKTDLMMLINKLEIESESYYFNNQKNIEDCNEIIDDKQYRPISPKNTKGYLIGLHKDKIYQTKLYSNNENLTLTTPNQNTKCDNKLFEVKDTSDFVTDKLESEPHSLITTNNPEDYDVILDGTDKSIKPSVKSVLLDTDQVAINNNNDDVISTSSRNHMYSVKLQHLHNTELQASISKSAMSCPKDTTNFDSKSKGIEDKPTNVMEAMDMKCDVLHSNQLGEREIETHTETLGLHREKLQSKQQCSNSIKNNKHDTPSKSNNEITRMDMNSMVLDTAQVCINDNKDNLTLMTLDLDGKSNSLSSKQPSFDSHTVQIDHHNVDIFTGTKIINESGHNKSIDMKPITYDANQEKDNCNKNCKTKSETKTVLQTNHHESYNEILKLKQSNSSSSTKGTKIIDKNIKNLEKEQPNKINIITRDVDVQLRGDNNIFLKSDIDCLKQLTSSGLRNAIIESESQSMNNTKESTVIQKSPLVVEMNQVVSTSNNDDISRGYRNSHMPSKVSSLNLTMKPNLVTSDSCNEMVNDKQYGHIRESLKNVAKIDMNSNSNTNKNISNTGTLLEQDNKDTSKKHHDSKRDILEPSILSTHDIERQYYYQDKKIMHVERKILHHCSEISSKELDDVGCSVNSSQDKDDGMLCNMQSNNCVTTDNTILIQKNSSVNVTDSFEDSAKHKFIKNNLSKNFGVSGFDESKVKIDAVSYNEDKDIIDSKINESVCPKNITLLYKSDSKVILKGSIIKDPIVGTCYVFPIINSEILRPVINVGDDYIKEDKTVTPRVCGGLFQDTDLVVTKPKITYSKTDLKLKYFSQTSINNDKLSRRNLKRKTEPADPKIAQKKYRKGKNIDNPKATAAAVTDFGYSKEFKNLSNYCNSIKFSYTKQYHLIQVDDVHTMLQNWPIKESTVSISNFSDINSDLFIDIEQRILLPDPMEQTLAEEILAIYDEKESTSPVINETNFSMGFGERSGRVDQNFIDVEESTKISAVTLSDVKQSQPFLQSVDDDTSNVQEIRDSREKQLRILDKCYSYIRLRDQVQSFFRKTTAELNYTWLNHNFKSEKRKLNSNDFLDTMSNFPFDLNISDFFEPPFTESIVQVVQVGQSPVSTGAQNPVTCDPRITHVSDASPPQCSIESIGHDDMEPSIKTEYTELTTADISLPLMPDYDRHHQGLISATQSSNLPVCNDNITIETEVKIEVLEEVPENMEEQSRYDTKDFTTYSSDQITNTEYSYDVNDIKVPIKTEEPDVKIMFEPAESNIGINQISEPYELQRAQQNVSHEKPDQLAHAMNAAGITTTPEPVPDTAMDLSNSLSRSVCSETDSNNYQRSNITAMTLQHALAQILPSSINQTNELETTPQVSVPSQILHIVHGKNTSLNQITLTDNTQQSVISTATPTPVLHIVQSKNGPTCSSSHSSPVHNSNSYSGLSLVDAGLSQGGNQLLHIVNTGNQKSNNTAQLLKRVNLLTNLTNVQGSNEQKMVQFVCKPADTKGIQLNTHQRSMVLRLHTIEPPQATLSKPECHEPTSRESPAKESIVPQELKSRSVYEENYAKFIQNSSKQPVIEKSTSLPKFNQAFGKPVFQEDNQKSNEIETNDSHLPSQDNSIESNGCQSTDNSLHLDNIRQIASPPLLLRKPSTNTVAQQNLVQQIKQAITPMNIQTMHGGVIYTRQIPVNIGGGQTINLITLPSTERIDDSGQKQKGEGKFGNRNEIEPSIIKIVPQSPASSNAEIPAEESNNSSGVSNENAQNSQPPPILTQMRIKLPMLSKTPQMVSAARVVRPSFFQIQRNVIGGPNQPVYQQLVLTAAPTLGQQSIRLPHAQTPREMKVGTDSQTSPESQMSSSTLEQLREFDMVLEQVKERSTVQPNGTPAHDFSKSHIQSTDTSENATRSTPAEATQQVLYSIGNNQSVNVAYVNRKSTVVSTTATTSFARSSDTSGTVQSSTSSSHASSQHVPHTVTSETTNGTHPPLNHHKSTKVSSKTKSRPKSHHPQFKLNSLPPKPSNQKPMEDEQTTQRILYILAEYKEQVENSPDKDKPAPRRRTNLQASVTPPGGSKRKKSSSGSRRSGRDSSPLDDNCRTMGSEDSSCGTSQGDCSETCQELHSPQSSPRKVAKKLSFDQDLPIPQTRQPQQAQPQPHQSQLHKQSQPQLQRNVLVTDGPTIAVTRAAPGKPATAVLMPANYILPVSMVKSGQQIAIVTNRGPKILTVGGGEGGTTNALLLQRLINPTGLKPMLARPGVRQVRLPTTALHNLQAFNLATAASAHQPPETASSPVPATSPPELITTKSPCSPWTSRDSGPGEEVKPEHDSSAEQPEPDQEPEAEPAPETDPDPEPWNVPHDYSYEETVRTEMDRTVLDAIPDRYSPDMEAQRIFDKMFDVESKKGYIDSQDDSPRCPYDIDASDCDDKAYHQVVQRRDGVTNRHRFVSAATLRQKFALMEDELRLQKSLSEECEDLGVDSPSASDLFPEAELLFSSSPAHEVSHQSHTPQPVILNQSSGISKPDLDDHAATDQLISREERPADEIDLGLEDVGIVTVSEDGMRATISLDHEEFVRSHPNTTFHSELTEEGEVQPVTLADLKARHITSTIFHAGRTPATVLVTAPQTTVISQATPDGSGVDHVRCSHADNVNNNDGVGRFEILNEPREPPNTTSAIIHSTGNATQVIRRVCYERDARYFLDEDVMNDPKMDDSRDATLESVDGDRSSPERHSELFWENPRRRDNRRLDFSSDSDKCCKSPYEENNSTDSSMGVNMRLDSVIKDARGIDRSDSTEDTNIPPLRTYPPKRTYHHDGHRNISGRAKPEGRFTDSSEGRRRASNRGVVKRGCHCCNGTTAPPKPKKPRQRKPALDFN